MSTVYEIAKWSEVFETSESRRHKSLSWVAMPIRLNSSGYQAMLDEFGDHAPAMYGAWCALVSFAAQQSTRGRLGNDQGKPVSSTMIARMTGFPSKLFDELFQWATRDDIQWLVPASDSVEHQEKTGKTDKKDTPSKRPAVAQDSPSDRPGITQPNPGLPDKPDKPDITIPDQTRPDLGVAQPVAGVLTNNSKAGSRSSKPKPSAFEGITRDTLRSNEPLMTWFSATVCKRKPVIADSEANLIRVFAAAERALEHGDDPLKLFAHIVGHAKWELISQDQEDRARKRLSELRASRAPPAITIPMKPIPGDTTLADRKQAFQQQLAALQQGSNS
jgi:hypothetical protein